VLAAVSLKGPALSYASPELRNDREIVLAAVSLNGPALQYASPALRNDREIVLASYGLAMRRIGLFAVSVGVLIVGYYLMLALLLLALISSINLSITRRQVLGTLAVTWATFAIALRSWKTDEATETLLKGLLLVAMVLSVPVMAYVLLTAGVNTVYLTQALLVWPVLSIASYFLAGLTVFAVDDILKNVAMGTMFLIKLPYEAFQLQKPEIDHKPPAPSFVAHAADTAKCIFTDFKSGCYQFWQGSSRCK
jgi:hypothetical protein